MGIGEDAGEVVAIDAPFAGPRLVWSLPVRVDTTLQTRVYRRIGLDTLHALANEAVRSHGLEIQL